MNDTVLVVDATADPDVGDFFTRLPSADYAPTWYQQRIAGALGQWEQQAAAKAKAHANTPTTEYFDVLGRATLTVVDNAAAGKYSARAELDIQGYQRSVTDALGRQVVVYDYDLLGTRIHQSSMEAGQRWMLSDVSGKNIRSWDDRGHNRRLAYDALRRPTNLYVIGTDPANSDPRTLAAELCYTTTIYGEGQANAQSLNLCTRVFQVNDVAGVTVHMALNPTTNQPEAFDFKGNLLRSSQQFVSDPRALTDWGGAAPSLLTLWLTSTTYDALNRPITRTLPDSSVTTPTYNERNTLKALSVNLRGAPTATQFVTDIEYNAKGQRLQINYGNSGVFTTYAYDPLTFRMTELTTTRPSLPLGQQVVQDLAYTYDPVANITHIQDDADLQNTIYFRNVRVEPSSDYTYDAIYRLIEAAGREQLGLAGGGPLAPTPTSYNDVPRIGLVLPGDGNAMGVYDEKYQYDAVGNFLSFIHRGSNPANPGWTRSYTYNEPSLLDAAQVSDRLTSTTISGSQALVEKYAYDPHGNMTAMPQLQQMRWDFLDQLQMTQRQAVNASDADGMLHQGEQTFFVYNAAGQRVRKTTVSAAGVTRKQRFYLGTFELYQEYDSKGRVTLERQTLQVLDDKRRIALVDTTTVDASAAPTSLPTATSRYQFGNHLGTALLELGENAAVISYEEYYPYGSTSYQAGRSVAEVSLKRYRYAGKERDEESGLYYFSARYYSPCLGRWASCDPAGFADGPNLYAFALANPVSNADPSGTQSNPALSSCAVDPTAPTPREEALQQSLPDNERYGDAQSPSSISSSGGGAAASSLGFAMIRSTSIPGAAPGTDFAAAAAQGRQAYRAANAMPAGTQVQHWTKELSAAATNMDPAVMNQNLSPLQSTGRATGPWSATSVGPATTLLTDPTGGQTRYQISGGSTYGNEHKFADRFLIPQIEDQIRAANPNATDREVAVEAGRQARWIMTGEPGPSPNPSAAASPGPSTALRVGGSALAVGGTVYSAYAFSQDVAEGRWGSAAVNGTGFAGGGLALGGTAVGSTSLVTAGTVIGAPAAVIGAGVAGWKLGEYTNKNTAISDVAAAGGSAVEALTGSQTLGAIGAAGTAILAPPVFVPIAVGKGIGSGATWLWNKIF